MLPIQEKQYTCVHIYTLEEELSNIAPKNIISNFHQRWYVSMSFINFLVILS